MEFVLFLLVVAVLLCRSGNRDAERIGRELLGVVVVVILTSGVVVALVVGFNFFPTVTMWILYTGAAVASALLLRWIYKRLFSPKPD